VEESGFLQPEDVKAALKDLEDLKARSTPQFKDGVQAEVEPAVGDNMDDSQVPPGSAD
jgi:hypothetical protein